MSRKNGKAKPRRYGGETEMPETVPVPEEERDPNPSGTARAHYEALKAEIAASEKRDPSVGGNESMVVHDSQGAVNDYDGGRMPDAFLDDFKAPDGKTLRTFLKELEDRFGYDEARRRLGLKVADPEAVASSRKYQQRLNEFINNLPIRSVNPVQPGTKEYLREIAIYQIANCRVHGIREDAIKLLVELEGMAVKRVDQRNLNVTVRLDPEKQRAAIEAGFDNWARTAGTKECGA